MTGEAREALTASLLAFASERCDGGPCPSCAREADALVKIADAYAAEEVSAALETARRTELTVAAAALQREEAAKAELGALAGRIGTAIRAAVKAERDRIRGPVEKFLKQYGDSEILMFKVAQDLANSILKLLADPDGESPGG
jgi:hypothetical protein